MDFSYNLKHCSYVINEIDGDYPITGLDSDKREAVIEEVNRYVSMCWSEYAIREDDRLSTGAIEFKNKILGLFDYVREEYDVVSKRWKKSTKHVE